MVTAVLPTMTKQLESTPGIASTFEPIPDAAGNRRPETKPRSATSQIAGIVGLFTGCGALVALIAFLPLPTRLRNDYNRTPQEAVQQSYYVVGSIALVVAIACSFGLRGLAGEGRKGFRVLFSRDDSLGNSSADAIEKPASYSTLVTQSAKLGFTDMSIGLGYLGGFVARASSVGISLFIPLYINAWYIEHDICKDTPTNTPDSANRRCASAYTTAAMLTGISQLVALLCAPIFGAVDGRFRRLNAPMMLAALAGVLGYILFPRVHSTGAQIGVVMLLGFSQIGAIVCSLSSLGRGIDYEDVGDNDNEAHDEEDTQENVPAESQALLDSPQAYSKSFSTTRHHLKGSIAGLYSLAGGAGILLLTKLGGKLFDTLSHGAPFYMLAAFNGTLLIIGLSLGIIEEITSTQEDRA
jgi:hypothetical protein